MLHGKGTNDDPLLARKVQFMDVTSMRDVETFEEGLVIILRLVEDDELHAFFFNDDDLKILVKKAMDLI